MNSPAYRNPVFAPYLQATSSLGSYGRYTGSASIGSRPHIGGGNRMYNFAHKRGKTQELLQEFSMAIYGKK